MSDMIEFTAKILIPEGSLENFNIANLLSLISDRVNDAAQEVLKGEGKTKYVEVSTSFKTLSEPVSHTELPGSSKVSQKSETLQCNYR